MSLHLVAIPIGHTGDISLRATSALSNAEAVICEQRKEGERFLRSLKLQAKQIFELNEHSDKTDLQELLELCRSQSVALITDCGTPGFCDPGAELVWRCRAEGIAVSVVPGASSLMTFLSGCGKRIDQFMFRGFLPANREEREIELRALTKVSIPIILMDTPYRLNRLLEDVQRHFPKRQVVLGHSLTTESESFVYGTATELLKRIGDQKLEFILMLI